MTHPFVLTIFDWYTILMVIIHLASFQERLTSALDHVLDSSIRFEFVGYQDIIELPEMLVYTEKKRNFIFSDRKNSSLFTADTRPLRGEDR